MAIDLPLTITCAPMCCAMPVMIWRASAASRAQCTCTPDALRLRGEAFEVLIQARHGASL